MYKRDRKVAFAINLDRDLRRVGRTTDRDSLRDFFALGGNEEEFQWNGLCSRMIYGSPKRGKELWGRTHTAIDFILFMLGLLLDHQQRMVEEIYQQVPAVPLRASTFVQCASINELSGRVL